jgi:hypothetical protein
MLPTDRELSPLDSFTSEFIAREFQAKLLRFRLENQVVVRKTPFVRKAGGELTPRLRDIAQRMAAAQLGNRFLEDKLLAVLWECDRVRIQRTLEPEWLVIEALFALCHVM